MKPRFLAPAAAVLLALGALGDHLLNPATSPPVRAATGVPVVSSATNVTTSNSTAPTITTSSIDVATERAYSIASPSVVYVSNKGVGSGSGIIFDAKGNIVTNNHVVSGATTLTVTLNDGRTFPATLVGTDRVDDLAVLHISASNITAAHFATAGGYRVAQTVLAIGSPLGLKQSVTSGLVSGLHRVEQESTGAYLPDSIQTSAPINPGNSGGALVTLQGTVVGMPTLVQTSSPGGTSTQNLGFAVPSERILAIAPQIIATGRVTHTGRAYLGISPGTSSSDSSSPFGQSDPNSITPSVSGAYIQSIASSGPAGRAGLQQGDTITSVDGVTITSSEDLLTALAQRKPGDTITLKYVHNGSTVTARVHLGELPA